jgi:TolB-like protein/tetratricopeptide (TPR) repeat protein
VDRVSALWRRLNEHKIVQWTIAYVALAYGIQHALTLTGEAFDWPRAVLRLSMLLFVLGLPLLVTFAWYHGARASRNFSQAELSIVSVLLVIASLGFYAFVRPGETVALRAASVQQAPSAAPVPVNGISVAVLPFVNLSADKDQEFFSDGMTEEITAALAQVSGLRVLGRTSAFQFKGQNKDLRAIGSALGATHIIEGSVRKAGNRVRVTAQLVRAVDDSHLWAQNYDRDLTDVFVIQDEIAKSIAVSLQVPLGLKQGETLVRSRTMDEATYETYLHAKALIRARSLAHLTEAAGLLEQVVARDPDYAPAWALLGFDFALTPFYHPAVLSETDEMRPVAGAALSKADDAAQRAIQLDPKSPDGIIAYGLVQNVRGKLREAEDLYRRAEALDPENADVLHFHSAMLGDLGYLKQSLVMRQRLQALEPLVPIFASISSMVMWANGQSSAAIALAQSSVAAGFDRNSTWLAAMYADQGRYAEAADLLKSYPAGVFAPGTVESAERLLRAAPAVWRQPLLRLGFLDFVYVYVGAADHALDVQEDYLKAGILYQIGGQVTLWTRPYAAVRKSNLFKTYARNAGMVDYWRARGWPDLCHPTTGDDFECS